MKDIIAKLQLDANCALGAIWMHIDAQAARIAELEAQIAASSDTDKLREAILALPYPGTMSQFATKDDMMLHMQGHEDALHEAAALVASTALQAPVREVPGWQPIETAPKDGTRVLLRGTPYAMLYAETKTLVGYFNKGWWMDTAALSHVTHWMPLPAAPVQTEPSNG